MLLLAFGLLFALIGCGNDDTAVTTEEELDFTFTEPKYEPIEITMPSFDVPEISLPEIHMPDYTISGADLPDISDIPNLADSPDVADVPDITEPEETDESVVGQWKIVHGYNEKESAIKEENELAIELCLNEDGTGTITENSQLVKFSWCYTETWTPQNNTSVQYKTYTCALDPDTTVSEEELGGEFYFEVRTDELDTIFLTYGNWLYLCERL